VSCSSDDEFEGFADHDGVERENSSIISSHFHIGGVFTFPPLTFAVIVVRNWNGRGKLSK